jgi:hypothetical protein
METKDMNLGEFPASPGAGFPLVSFAASGVKRIPLQSLARESFPNGIITKEI